MITTLTTMTMGTMIAASGLTAAISVALVATLMVFLTTRELASAGLSRFSSRIARATSVAILPLVMVFAAIVALKFAEIL